MSVIIRFDRIIQNPYKRLDPLIESEDDKGFRDPEVLLKDSSLRDYSWKKAELTENIETLYDTVYA